ncbi:glycosyltransferase family 2 protein (plasmid) [Staphylococcus casei]|uniref:glycosyltransferase family 2 protein n=1 Tax=Staphylococcus casei TaxID=201828 RepID=UPI002570CF83|nr:glycosyltransferase family 2 protein [Staphylococcus casei]WJE87766.1 glycosyltransferase family 2 protein [Staphylococcus casei]
MILIFSVIIPTYNSENVIDKTLNKLLKQLPYLDDEIIVINDGSKDRTKQKLKQFEKYNQIKVIHQTNRGVSASRNVGISQISLTTQYVTFLDDSDSVSDNFFMVAQKFFNNYPNISILSIPILLLHNCVQINHNSGKETEKSEQIFDIIEQPTELQYHIGGMVFKKSLFEQEKYYFDENAKYWEDAKLINTIFLDKRFYGVSQNAKYYYDKKNENSLSQLAWRYRYRYSPQIINNYMPLIQKSIQIYGKSLEYIQHLIASHFVSYIHEDNQMLLVDKFLFEDCFFKKESIKLFNYISLQTIDNLNIPNRYKAFLYSIKGENFPNKLYMKNITIYMHGYEIFKGKLHFSLSHEAYGLSKNTSIYVRNRNGKISYAQLLSSNTSIMLGEQIFDISKNKYKIKISLSSILFGTYFYINDKSFNSFKIVKSEPIFKRIFSTFIKKFFYIKSIHAH